MISSSAPSTAVTGTSYTEINPNKLGNTGSSLSKAEDKGHKYQDIKAPNNVLRVSSKVQHPETIGHFHLQNFRVFVTELLEELWTSLGWTITQQKLVLWSAESVFQVFLWEK